MAGAERVMRTAAASPAPKTDTAAGPARPAASSRPAAGPAPITRDTTIDVAAQRLAADLRAIPGIERFGAVRLAELERGGPRPLRTMWRIARDQLDERYGQVTIGELIDRYRGSSPSA
jgi:nucleotidyltransferase/DNA polymerase involved in DNA repair